LRALRALRAQRCNPGRREGGLSRARVVSPSGVRRALATTVAGVAERAGVQAFRTIRRLPGEGACGYRPF